MGAKGDAGKVLTSSARIPGWLPSGAPLQCPLDRRLKLRPALRPVR